MLDRVTINAYRREWYQRNKDKRTAQARAWYHENPTYRSYEDRKLDKSVRLSTTYSHMRARVEGRGGKRDGNYVGLPCLAKEVFMDWAENDPSFHSLWDAWVTSGFVRRLTPSIDRIRPEYGYILGNLQWLTLSQNVSKMRTQERKALLH